MISQTLCTVFKTNLLKGLENFASGSIYDYKIALYVDGANLGADTTAYTTDFEVPAGNGYSTGGKDLSPTTPTSNGTTAFVSFSNVTWDPASFTAKGALVYNSTTNAAVCVLNFGADKTATSTFTVTFPTENANSAIIRIA